MTMNTIYDVPLVPYNLRREETVVQIAEALNYLSDVTADIFARVNKRIEENQLQVDSLAKRLTKASEKLTNLAGAKNATQVFSSSKYPAESVHHQYKTIFESHEKLAVKKIQYEYKTEGGSSEFLEPLQLYYVKLKKDAERKDQSNFEYTTSNIETINDVIVFNTGVFCDDSLHKSTSGHVASGARKSEKEDGNLDIVAAPLSISESLVAQKRSANEAYFYSPHLGNVPTIDVPRDLPDLPGIADDLRYKTQREVAIAPSVVLAIPDLPEIEENPVKETNSALPVSTIEPEAKNVTLITNSEKDERIINVELKENVEKTDVQVEKRSTIKEKPEMIAKTPIINDARANLMEAIRKAGGSKTLKPIVDSDEPKSSIGVPADDLMADLYAKLAMRRKGISSNKFDKPSTMEKISAMIPPPPAVDDASESNGDDDDEWD